MRKHILWIVLLIASSCSLFKNTTAPSSVKIIYVHDSARINIPVRDTIHDSTTVVLPVIVTIEKTVGIPADTIASVLLVAPGGTPEETTQRLQGAITYQQTHSVVVKLMAATYYITRPLLVYTINGNDYGQSFLDIEGPTRAKDTRGDQISQIISVFNDGPVIAVQKGKGCTIKNISFSGQYAKANKMSWLSVDTLLWGQWSDGASRVNRTSPYCAIAIDPFSDPRFYTDSAHQMYPGLQAYYLPGMNQAGSTDVVIDGCQFTQFPVGVIVTPSMQFNGECIRISDCSFTGCMSAVVQTQAQSKMNRVTNCMFWGGNHTIIDCAHWGFQRGDAVTMPYVDGVNIAGYNFEFVAGIPINFESSFAGIHTDGSGDSAIHLYAEGLFRLCDFGGFPAGYPGNAQAGTRSGVTFRDSHIDFMTTQPGIPSPDFYVSCAGCTFDGMTLVLYNNIKETDRLPLNDETTVYRDCVLGYYPIGVRTDPAYNMPTIFDNIRLTGNARYPPVSASSDPHWWETQIPIGMNTIHIDRTNFNGYIIDSTHIFKLWDYVIGSQMPVESISAGAVKDVIVGIVNGQTGDTIRLQNMGRLMQEGVQANLFINRLSQ